MEARNMEHGIMRSYNGLGRVDRELDFNYVKCIGIFNSKSLGGEYVNIVFQIGTMAINLHVNKDGRNGDSYYNKSSVEDNKMYIRLLKEMVIVYGEQSNNMSALIGKKFRLKTSLHEWKHDGTKEYHIDSINLSGDPIDVIDVDHTELNTGIADTGEKKWIQRSTQAEALVTRDEVINGIRYTRFETENQFWEEECKADNDRYGVARGILGARMDIDVGWKTIRRKDKPDLGTLFLRGFDNMKLARRR